MSHDGGRSQTRTLHDDSPTGVVLQVEQVPRVLGHLSPTGAEVQACEVNSGSS
jgi:streptogramin lyase